MKIPAIKTLVESYGVDTLKAAEAALMEEEPLPIEVGGADEGEQLTHLIAAIWIMERMGETQQDFKTTLREYTARVRESIS